MDPPIRREPAGTVCRNKLIVQHSWWICQRVVAASHCYYKPLWVSACCFFCSSTPGGQYRGGIASKNIGHHSAHGAHAKCMSQHVCLGTCSNSSVNGLIMWKIFTLHSCSLRCCWAHSELYHYVCALWKSTCTKLQSTRRLNVYCLSCFINIAE